MTEHIHPVAAAVLASSLWTCVIVGVLRDLRKSSRGGDRG